MAQKTESKQQQNELLGIRQPAIFINHGAGPMPYLQLIGKGKKNSQMKKMNDCVVASLQNLTKIIKKYKPKALCMISAHWEESIPTVLYESNPSLLFDYYGFPKEAYTLKYSAPISLTLTDKLIAALKENGRYKKVNMDKQRGYDHGVFIPLMIAWPAANIPIIQLSLQSVTKNRLENAQNNLRLGSVLNDFRNEGVMVIGSGLSYHNMRGFLDKRNKEKSKEFNEWLIETIAKKKSIKECVINMMNWMDAPSALDCHPREEHLLPLHVCLGSNMSVQAMDELFAQYAKDKKVKYDEIESNINVNVTKFEDDIISYSAFEFV